MADDAVNALIPVAAVVHIALGVMALILVRRSEDKEWNELYAGYIISWMMIILGIKYTFATIIDLRLEDLTGQDIIDGAYSEIYYSSHMYAQMAMDSAFMCLLVILPLVYPYPILQKENVAKICTCIVILLGIIVIPLDIFTEFTNRDMKSALSWLCYLIWVPIYLRFIVGEIRYGEDRAREVSSVVLLLLLASKVQWMIFWLQHLTGLSKLYLARWIVEDVVFWGTASQTEISIVIFSPIAMTLSGLTFLVLLGGELWRAYHKGINGISVSVGVVFIVGVMWFLLTLVVKDTATSCVDTICAAWDQSFIDWYAFTFQVAVYLIVPLIFMFIILNYNIVDTDTNQSKVITRIMVLLLLLVATSSLIEMIQIVLPIPEMVTSALFAGGVVLFIGWEEKIMNKMITDKSNSVEAIKSIMSLNNPDIDSKDYRVFSIAIISLIIYGLLLSVLFDSMGLHS
tara:strand:- start:2564 stop:3934 length:1371 start_codon:yes stop_codon:yes gene_type:complete